MAPKKASQTAATAAATAADYFTKSKKPTTTDRTLTLKKSVTTTTATAPTSTTLLSATPSPTFSNNSNKKFTTQQKRQALKRKGQQILQDAVIVILDNDKDDNEKENIDKSSVATTAAHEHVDISGDVDDERIDNNNTTTIHARVDTNHGDDRDPTVLEEDLGPLDGFLFDDSFELQRSQCSQGSQSHRSQNKLSMATTIMEPLTKAPLLKTSPEQRYQSHSKVTPVGIKSGIHQSGISEHEKMLRQFDLTSKYGPCLNMTRLERWERALQLGLAPPMDIKDELIKDATLNDPIFAGRV
ncbi:MAG: DNA polymerase delta, subunit 4-domain-containing protein [Linnemannia gamsii]|nr:MAG: DNA polymerase delta, subunit 4-domain-containing protein [Linnemannia gamsii]